ncbi:MAG: hypothetical protein CEN89_578 [Candidatus Berkelbacteria bacterium Licking1014_7]|uniref:PPC domain-containing protein n=1 Tax=Candidatus Berkelbacteria bacterium Licking1014_7 TaxID=2017147 RepID=A0A554LII4_9BACT|nr:MAG: hypothetical protein CEN89_578 [Candidatus Berkelbacteria bacterium Licking1014_7]
MHIYKLSQNSDFFTEIEKICQKNAIKAGWLNAIGALSSVTLAHFNPDGKIYTEKTISKQVEIVSLSGVISLRQGKIHFHLHIVVADNHFKTYAGHLKSATVNPTCEVAILSSRQKLTRDFDPKIGLDILNTVWATFRGLTPTHNYVWGLDIIKVNIYT